MSRALKGELGGEKLAVCEIGSVAAESKAIWKRREDGAWVAPANVRPGQDVLTLSLTAKSGGSFLRLDFLTDPSLPASGPGQAGNGNAVISEIEIAVAGKPVKAEVFSSVSAHHSGRVVAHAFDGVKQPGDTGWDAESSGWETGMSKPAQLIVKLDAPVSRGAAVTVRIFAKTRWGQHVPGCVAAAVVGGDHASGLSAQLEALRVELKNWQTRVSARWPVIGNTNTGTQVFAGVPASMLVSLAQSELLRAVGDEELWKIVQAKGGGAFLAALVSDQEWLESFLLGGVEGTGRSNYAQALENLRLIHSQFPTDVWRDPVSKRLAAAIALQAGRMNRYRLVERFHLIESARANGKLHAGFDQLDVRAMGHAINLNGTAFEFQGWLNETQFTAGGYVGACWAVPYVDPSVYGYSVQGWGFHDPLRHAYPTAKIYRGIGGVCGTLSRFGANSALAHGVPAFTVGQPAHCAYVVRIGVHWATGNDVSGPHSNSWSAYDGLGFTSTNALLEKTENASNYLTAQRVVWLARLEKDAGKPIATWRRLYATALTVQPKNYAVWLEYIKALEEHVSDPTAPAIGPGEWVALGRAAAETFKEHQEAGWALAIRCFDHAKSQFPIAGERSELLVQTHEILSQKAVPTMYGYDIGRFLNWQVDWIGDADAAVDFFGKLLAVHRSEKPELNWVFGAVMSWGRDRFAGKPDTSAGYASVLGKFFEGQGENADKEQAKGMIAASIRKCSESGDAAGFHTWLRLAKKLLPPLGPGDVHLQPDHLTLRPAIEPFPGMLLSATGMLQTSSVSYDKPLSYGQVLDGGEFGYFDTAHESKPWALVALAGEGALSGIVLVNRYEFPSEKPWDVPLKVEVSSDGTNWTEVAQFEEMQDVYRVDLLTKEIRAKYVRIERGPGSDPAKPNNGRLHMRNFLVYGRPLY